MSRAISASFSFIRLDAGRSDPVLRARTLAFSAESYKTRCIRERASRMHRASIIFFSNTWIQRLGTSAGSFSLSLSLSPIFLPRPLRSVPSRIPSSSNRVSPCRECEHRNFSNFHDGFSKCLSREISWRPENAGTMVALTRHRIDLILDPSIVECCRSRDLSDNYQLGSSATSASMRQEKWAMKRDGLPEYKSEASRVRFQSRRSSVSPLHVQKKEITDSAIAESRLRRLGRSIEIDPSRSRRGAINPAREAEIIRQGSWRKLDDWQVCQCRGGRSGVSAISSKLSDRNLLTPILLRSLRPHGTAVAVSSEPAASSRVSRESLRPRAP